MGSKIISRFFCESVSVSSLSCIGYYLTALFREAGPSTYILTLSSAKRLSLPLLQVEMVLHVEQALPERLRRHWLCRRQVLHPNKRSLLSKMRRWITSEPTQLSVDTIVKQINRESVTIGFVICSCFCHLEALVRI